MNSPGAYQNLDEDSIERLVDSNFTSQNNNLYSKYLYAKYCFRNFYIKSKFSAKRYISKPIITLLLLIVIIVTLFGLLFNTPSVPVHLPKSSPIFDQPNPVLTSLRGGVSDHLPNVNATIFALVRNDELEDMQATIKRFESRFNHRYNYPYTFFNDVDFTQEFMDGIRAVTNAPVSFHTLDPSYWEVPDHIDQEKFNKTLKFNRKRYLYGGSVSYRKMCRYQSMLFYDHPEMKKYRYYWRIEPDVDYYCNIDYDPFRFMQNNDLVYGYTITMGESRKTIETLWMSVKEWVASNTHFLPPYSIGNWLVKPNGDFNLCHFWSNFEIVDLEFYRSPAYRSFVDYLDKKGGFFYERWGDAPVHTIAAAILLPKHKIFRFDDIGYRHSVVYYCPPTVELSNSCSCNIVGSSNNYKCNKYWDRIDSVPLDSFLSMIRLQNPRY